MTMMPEDKKTVTQKLFFVGISAFVLGALAIAGVKFFLALADSGDTPVILLGGSLTFKAGDKNTAWDKDSATQYHVSPSYAVGAIVVKAKPAPDSGDSSVGDDINPKTDRLFVNLANATSWEIDEYTTVSDVDPVAAISATSSSNNINLALKDQKGFFCANKSMKRISYGLTQDCSDSSAIKFAKIRVTVNDHEIGMLNCIDQDNKLGVCRIVFRKAAN
jgi:hypothetical protein